MHKTLRFLTWESILVLKNSWTEIKSQGKFFQGEPWPAFKTKISTVISSLPRKVSHLSTCVLRWLAWLNCHTLCKSGDIQETKEIPLRCVIDDGFLCASFHFSHVRFTSCLNFFISIYLSIYHLFRLSLLISLVL